MLKVEPGLRFDLAIQGCWRSLTEHRRLDHQAAEPWPARLSPRTLLAPGHRKPWQRLPGAQMISAA